MTGDQTHVFYDVDCRKLCEDEDEDMCVNNACGSEVIFIPKRDGLNVNHVILGNLSSFVVYTMQIFAKNRVSELARRKHGTEANLGEISVRTNGSVPGKPEVFVEQLKTAVVVSWKIKVKNGILKECYVTSVRKDDLSKTQTLVTKKMEAQFDLKAGKTYQFQSPVSPCISISSMDWLVYWLFASRLSPVTSYTTGQWGNINETQHETNIPAQKTSSQ